MTHEYTLLLGATVLLGPKARPCEALAWAAGTILAIGTAAEIRAISRGDSHVMALDGLFVVPLGAPLEVGGPADLIVLSGDPRDPARDIDRHRVAVIRGGHVVAGSAPSGAPAGN